MEDVGWGRQRDGQQIKVIVVEGWDLGKEVLE